MSKWEMVKLGDVCDIERGGSPRPIENYITEDENGVNWIKIGDAPSDSMYISQAKQRIKPEGIKKSRYVKYGDFLLSNSMSFGRPYILRIEGCIHDGWLVLRDKCNYFHKEYLYYALSSQSTIEKFKSLAVGGVVNNLNTTVVKQVKIPLPPLEIQREIAKTLDTVSEILAMRKQQIAELDNLIKSIFYDMFGDPVINEKGWTVYSLRDIARVETGSTPSRNNPKYYINGNIPWVKTGEIDYGYIKDTEERITEEALNETNCKVLPKGTVLMAMYGQGKTRGKVGLLCIEAATNQACAAIITTDKCNPEFLYRHFDLRYDELRFL